MTRYVIDARTLVQLALDGAKVDTAHQLVAPNVIRSQALDLLLDAVRQGTLTRTEAIKVHERLTEIKLRLLGDRVSRRTALETALDQGWDTTSDAEYIAVTKLQADALVTTDHGLAQRARSLVRVCEPEVLTTSSN